MVSIVTTMGFDETTLSADAVGAKVDSEYLAEVRGCYSAELAKDPTARGKVAVTFTVDEHGRAVMSKVRGFTDAVDTCISATIKSWAFPIPKDSDGDVTDAVFTVTLQMLPG